MRSLERRLAKQLGTLVLGLAASGALSTSGWAAQTKLVFATPHAATGAPERLQYFLAANRDLEVEIVSLAGLSLNQIHDKLFSMLAAGQQIDVIRLPGPAFTEWLSKDLLLDLSPFLEGRPAILQDMHPFVRRAVSRGGRVYGLPEDPTTDWVVVNLGAFARAGLQPPEQLYQEGQWTWETLRATSRKLKALGTPERPYYPITTLLNDDLGTMPWVMGAGGDFFDETGTVVKINQPDTRRGLQFILDLITDGLVNTPNAPIGWQDILKQDRWGVAVWWVTFPSWLRQNTPETEIDLIPLPRSPYQDAVPANMNTYVIPAATRHPREAFRLASWLGGPQHYELALTGRAHPNQNYIFSWPSAYRSADRLFIDIVGRRLGTPGVKYYPDVVARARAINQPAQAGTTAKTRIYQELAKVFNGQQPLDATLRNLEAELQGLLSSR